MKSKVSQRKYLVIVLIFLSLALNGQNNNDIRTQIKDSVDRIINIDTIQRKKHGVVYLYEYNGQPIDGSFSQLGNIGKPIHLPGVTFNTPITEKINKKFKIEIIFDSIDLFNTGEHYKELLITRTTYKTKLRNGKRKLLYKSDYKIVHTVSGLYSYNKVKEKGENSINCEGVVGCKDYQEKFRLIKWLLINASSDELNSIIMNYQHPILQYYSIEELKYRNLETFHLHDYLSNEFVEFEQIGTPKIVRYNKFNLTGKIY